MSRQAQAPGPGSYLRCACQGLLHPHLHSPREWHPQESPAFGPQVHGAAFSGSQTVAVYGQWKKVAGLWLGTNQSLECSIKGCVGIYSLDLLQILISVLVSHIGRTDVKFEVWSKVFKVVIVWKL